jgi:hypothetical protein
MRPHERKLIRRLMIVATVLVAVMAVAMIWTALQSGGRGPASGPRDPTAAPAGSGAP